ncbi:hypothetical protein [Litoreibacter halocynthiae]|uniref:hypothetical protein n=1 Tax=Litoreibacter halocynthiae TaxID=1242689 RepID=UPI0024927AFD|nr:hypothetical protein [Litoreibacter halocynthiae]
MKTAETARIVDGFAGKTIRFDEQNMRYHSVKVPKRYNRFIVYFEPDGLAYVWLPGKRPVAVLPWSVKVTTWAPDGSASKTNFHGKLCFSGFLTRGRDFCRFEKQLEISIQEIADGDVFGLRNLKVPCRLCRADVDFATARKTLGSL